MKLKNPLPLFNYTKKLLYCMYSHSRVYPGARVSPPLAKFIINLGPSLATRCESGVLPVARVCTNNFINCMRQWSSRCKDVSLRLLTRARAYHKHNALINFDDCDTDNVHICVYIHTRPNRPQKSCKK